MPGGAKLAGVEMQADGFKLRPWARGDEDDLVRHADNRAVWRNLTNRFPHPYRRVDAATWIDLNEETEGPPHNLAIVLPDGEAIGGVGLQRLDDLHTRTAEVGYWLGEAYWGQGIATRAARELTSYALREFDFVRLQAGVIAWNPASCRVLEKCGFELESRQRCAVFKDDEVVDLLLYVRLRDA